MNDQRLSIRITHSRPIELLDLASSLLSLEKEYRCHINRKSGTASPDNVKLCIKEIRSGSIEIDLIAIAAAGLPGFDYADTLIEFLKHIMKASDYLGGKSPEKPDLTTENLKNIKKIVEPTAKDQASQTIYQFGDNAKVNIAYQVSSVDANAIQNGANRELGKLKEPETGKKELVLLYWYQTHNDPHRKVGDRAIIDSVFPDSVKTIVPNPTIKKNMISKHPFKNAFLVDVDVETVEGKPALYKVTHLHEIMSNLRQTDHKDGNKTEEEDNYFDNQMKNQD